MRKPGPVAAALLLTNAVLVAVGAAGFVSPSELFRHSAALKAEEYLMAEFEFKRLATLHLLNEGRYGQANRTLRRIRHEMRSREGLVKMPRNATTEELIAFHLARQDPGTGAFPNDPLARLPVP